MTIAENEVRAEYKNSFALFVSALEYIEQNLCSDLSQEKIASECFCSLSTLQKTWRYCTHMSVKEYITKRRLTLAGRALIEEDLTALEAAMRFGYNSHEVFTRAFTRVWGVSPSKFKRQWKGSCVLYPRLDPAFLEGERVMNVKKFDVTEFYDYLKTMIGTYVLCFDIERLMEINNVLGREAGDKAILESFRRINEAAAEKDMLCLRIGGDEFALITGTDDTEKVKDTAQQVLSHNGENVVFGTGEVSVSLRCGAVRIERPLKYTSLCEDFTKAINKARYTGEIAFV